MATWSRVSDPENDGSQLPAWFVSRMTAVRGAFGLLLATGDVLRVISLSAAHVSSDGIVLLDVLLDHAGVPDGVDTAWAVQALSGCALTRRDQGHGQHGPCGRRHRVLGRADPPRSRAGSPVQRPRRFRIPSGS